MAGSENRSASPKPTAKGSSSTASAAGKSDSAKPEAAKQGSVFSLKNIVIMTVVAAAAVFAFQVLGDKKKMTETTEAVIVWVQNQGENAMYFYLVVTLIGVVCLVPTTPLEFAGGFLFSAQYGMWTTWALTSVAKLIANVISVWIARHLVKDLVTRMLVERYDLLKMVSKAVKEEPYKMAFLVRGSMVPLCVKNYGLGVLDIGYIPIACCSCIFTPFYAFQNIYIGSVCTDLKEVFAPKKPSADAGDWTSTAKSLMPVVFQCLLIFVIVRAIKGQIKKAKSEIQENLNAKTDKKNE